MNKVTPRLEHNRIAVSNLDECIAFYTDLFDFKVRWSGALASGEKWVHLGTEYFYLSLSQAVQGVGKKTHPASYKEFQGFTHMGWVVTDLDAYKTRLKDMGIVGIDEVVTEFGTHLYVFDPHGNEVELIEYFSPGKEY